MTTPRKKSASKSAEAQARIRRANIIMDALNTQMHDKAELVQLTKNMLSKGIDPNIVDGNKAPLLLNAYHNCRDVFDLLLPLPGLDLFKKDGLHNDILQYMMIANDTDGIEQLVKAGMDIHHRDNQGCSLILRAAWMDELDCFKKLQELGANIHDTDTVVDGDAFYWCAMMGAKKIGPYLLSQGFDINRENNLGNTPLFHNFEWGNAQCVDTMIAMGADPFHVNKAGEGAFENINFTIASADKIVKNMCARGVPIRGMKAFESAIKQSRWGCVRDMTPHCSNINAPFTDDGETLLMALAKSGQQGDVQSILAMKTDLTVKDKKGRDALFYACGSNAPEIMKDIIAAGADIYAKDNAGNTLLHMAVASYSSDSLHFLLTRGLDPDTANKAGKTAYDVLDKTSGEMFKKQCADMMRDHKEKKRHKAFNDAGRKGMPVQGKVKPPKSQITTSQRRKWPGL